LAEENFGHRQPGRVMTTFSQFDEGLTAWSGQLSRNYNPVMNPAMKNRLQAIGEIRSRLSNMQPSGEFHGDIVLLMKAVETCQVEFDPMFDTEYGSGRDIHNSLIGLLKASETRESFDAGWRNLVE
jgi:hypothetical protein